ncbi:PFK5, partial [Symbiodinium pilosum]
SIRAGNVRRQGTLPTDKPVRFAQTSLLDACPFKVDLFAPLGSSRLVLRPKSDRYTVSFGDSDKKMSLDLLVQGLSEAGPDKPQPAAPREELLSETEAYLERHELQHFIQNLITSVLADKPDDPYAYMAHHLSNVRVRELPRPPSVQATPNHAKRQLRKPARLPPHKKSFDHPAFVVEDYDGNLLTLRELEAKDIMCPGAELRRLVIDDLSKVGLTEVKAESTGRLGAAKDRNCGIVSAACANCLGGSGGNIGVFVSNCTGQVIRELVMMLAQYGAMTSVCVQTRRIAGSDGVRDMLELDGVGGSEVVMMPVCRSGGAIAAIVLAVVKPESWMEMTPDNVQDINNMGGTILVSDRGNPTEEEQVQTLIDMGVRAHFIIGGDGTHRGAFDCAELMKAKGWNCSVVGIPKTIDNDIPMLDCTFGFDTACMEAERAIKAGYVEATCNANCIGLVKLMGRHSGFIALHACLAARHADIVLLPEMQISLEKVLRHCLELMQSKGHSVVVVAEGCGDTLLKSSGEVDGGGNKKLADVGPWLRDKLLERFKQVKLPLTVKYIDPTYMIRAIGPNANDSVYCSSLSHNAVHAAMAGYTGITVGQISSRQVLLPIACVTKNPQFQELGALHAVFLPQLLGLLTAGTVCIAGTAISKPELVSSTLQPNLAPEGAEEEVMEAAAPAMGSGNGLKHRSGMLSLFVAACGNAVSVTEVENPLLHNSEPVEIVGAIGEGSEVRRLELEHLSLKFGDRSEPTTLMEQVKGGKVCFFDQVSWVTQTLGLPGVRLQMLKAGPRTKLYFKPAEVAATIVTCGGLCPGLNSVIRELVMMLYAYGVKKVYGIKGGFKGVVNPQSWVTLTPENVCMYLLRNFAKAALSWSAIAGIHRTVKWSDAKMKDCMLSMYSASEPVGPLGTKRELQGFIGALEVKSPNVSLCSGTWTWGLLGVEEKERKILVAASIRGSGDTNMAKALKKRGVRQHFVLGGDGTQKGAYQTYEQMQAIGWECAVVGIPKTIDNDINLLDRSFGFDTAMTEAQKAIEVAYVEATCNANAIGLVKLMGRHCGYLTMMSVLAARHVDICLLPEMDINLEKVLDHCVELVSTSGYAVVVVAEGCGDTLLSSSGATDEGGNKKINDVGPWLKDAITSHFKNLKLPITIKYVDPTYMVRAVPANPNDSIYCSELAQAAVHAAMAGYTGVTVGKVDQQTAETSMPSRVVDINGPLSMVDPDKSDVLRVPDTTLTITDGSLLQRCKARLCFCLDDLQDSTELRSLQCFNLSERYGTFDIPSTLKGVRLFSDNFSWTSQALFLGNRLDSGRGVPYFKMTRAGPREFLHFDPHDPASAAAIISCGGICPGLNCVIREIVNTLWAYGVRRIYGIKGGYKGILEPDKWLNLNPEVVKDIHTEGGTMLISDRGNPPHMDMARALQSKNIRQYFVLGGDGTHKGAMQTFNGMMEIDHECAVVGVPKTIDNDVPMIDQTFGFDTACTEAAKAVNSAYVEARGNANCIGLVKLMGRHCGFIAMNAALAARNVDICLIPEMDIDLEKVLQHTEHLMRTKGHAVIVVAEGCGDTLIQSSGATDAGGNKILADVGPWLKDTITARFKSMNLPLTIKYIDPTYMIRSVPANSFDSTYCSVLGQMAVHGAMAGYSGITVGKIYERYCYLPIHAITNQKGKRVNPNGRWFFRMRESTKQPDFRNGHRVVAQILQDCNKIAYGPAEVMDFHAAELLAAWDTWLSYGCVTNGLSVAEQKEAFLKTENAFYYSYYEEFVSAPDLGRAFNSALYDRRSEAPDTINALKRFNVYQEVICGAFYRFAAWLCGRQNLVDPWYFFRSCSYALQGLGHVGLLRLAAAVGGDGIFGGLVPGISLFILTFLHRHDFSRIHDVGMLELRENWAMPVILYQVWTLTKLLMTHPSLCSQTTWEFLGWRWAFRSLTVVCILVWQFSAFAFLLQVSAAFLCTLLACHPGARLAMNEVVNSHLVALTIAAVLLFGNELLVHHLLVTQCIAIKTVLWLRSAPRWRLLFWLDGALAVLMFVLLRIIQMPFATADEHVWELYANKMRTLFPSYLGKEHHEPTFNTRLYNAVSVFDFISWKNIEVGFQTKVYHFAAAAALLQAGAFLVNILPHAGHTKQTVGEGYSHAFSSSVLLVQTALFLVLGCFISRLKCIGVPFLLVWATAGLAPRPLIAVCPMPASWPIRALRIGIFATAAALQLGQLVFLAYKLPFIENRHTSIHADKSWPDGDRGEFFNWLVQHVPKDEIILAAMPLSAELRLTTPLRVAIHPQFEAQHLRDRVQELYQWYQCTPPASFAKTMQKYGSQYVILEFKRCSFGPFLLDRYPEVNCKEGERPWHDLFCPRALASPLFELLWANAEFALLRLRRREEVPKSAKAGSVEDIQTWEPMLRRCLAEEPAHCAARAADLALSFRKMGQGKVSRTLFQWAEQHGSEDAAFQYIRGHHLDYDLQESERAGPYYRRAYELDSNNPVFLKEYLMWLELVAKDNRSLVELLGPHRLPRQARKTIQELGDPALACEASITTRELLQDHDWSRELWEYALEHGVCNQCVENNWALHAPSGRKMRDDVGDWQLFLNAFWHRAMRSTLMGEHLMAELRALCALLECQAMPAGMEPISGESTALSKHSSINELLQPGDTVKRLEVVNLGDQFPSAQAVNEIQFPGDMAMGPDSWSTQTLMRHNRRDDRGRTYLQLLRSGPRKILHFAPSASSAVIVTCGGLCPGLNSVIREIVMTLTRYGVKSIYGCRGGYKGMVQPDNWMTLTPDVVQDIHKEGGTILVSDRGNPPHMEIAQMLQQKNVKQYFVIGGDGTQAGAFETFTSTQEIGHEVAVVGVPKTIDNDIPVLDRSFGFNTACSEAEKAIDSAYVEATCNSHCIGLVKLMGRHCGFIALHATLAARSVDICLLPEMDISLPRVLHHAMHLMKTKGHARS